MTLALIIISFIIFTFLISFVYFILFAKTQQSFVKYWALSWISYSFSLTFLILSMTYENLPLLEIRKIFDMFNIMFLLFGAYAFCRKHVPSYWYRFSLYLMIWMGIGIYYGFDLMPVYLPVSVYQMVITGVMCYVIFKFWESGKYERFIYLITFAVWGFGKAAVSLVEARSLQISHYYLIEMLFSNILIFCIFFIYLRKTKIELDQTERLFLIIAENAADIIFYYQLSPQPKFTFVTPSVMDLTGYTVQDFYSNHKFYLEMLPAEYFHWADRIFSELSESEKERVFPLVHKNGNTHWMEINTKVIYSKEGNIPIAVEGMIRDISQMKLAKDELISSKQSRELFLSYVSHELRTPVTSILGYINAVKDGTLSTMEEKNKALDIIYSKALILERLINDLFQLSKLETNQFSFNFIHISAKELSISLMDKHIMDIKNAGLSLKYEIDEKSLENQFVIIDQDRIDQVFGNLIFNAIKYTKTGDKLSVKCDLNHEKNYLQVKISDTGQGIASQDIPHIFDRFFKTSIKAENHRNLSTGLGLTISREIIRAHKGEIWVKSRLGKGSTFTFTIPLFHD